MPNRSQNHLLYVEKLRENKIHDYKTCYYAVKQDVFTAGQSEIFRPAFFPLSVGTLTPKDVSDQFE